MANLYCCKITKAIPFPKNAEVWPYFQCDQWNVKSGISVYNSGRSALQDEDGGLVFENPNYGSLEHLNQVVLRRRRKNRDLNRHGEIIMVKKSQKGNLAPLRSVHGIPGHKIIPSPRTSETVFASTTTTFKVLRETIPKRKGGERDHG